MPTLQDVLGFVVNPPPGDPTRTASSDQLPPPVVFDIRQFGPVGGLDDTTTWQAAANAGGRIWLPSGSFNVLNGIAISGPVQFLGSGMGRTIINRPANTFDWISGGGSKTTLAGNAGLLTANVAAGATVLPVTNGAAFAVGAYYNLRSTLTWPGSTNGKVGEIVRVLSIAGNNVTLYEPIYEAYATANGAICDLINFVSGFRIADLTFRSTQLTGTHGAINVSYLLDPSFERVEGAGLDSPGIQVNTCLGARGFATVMHDLTDDTGNNRVGYGINESGACQDSTWVAPRAMRVRHSYTTNGSADGVPHNCGVLSGVAAGTTAAGFDTHEDGRHIKFTACRAVGCATSFNTRAPDVEHIHPTSILALDADYQIASTALRCKLRAPVIRQPAHTNRGILQNADDCTITDPDIDMGGGTTAECLIQLAGNRLTLNSGTLRNPGSSGSPNTGINLFAGSDHVIDTTVDTATTGINIGTAGTPRSIKVHGRNISGNVVNGTNFNGDQARAITMSTGNFVLTNNVGVAWHVLVTGGTISEIDRSPDGSSWTFTGATVGSFYLGPGESLRIINSVVPTVTVTPIRQ